MAKKKPKIKLRSGNIAVSMQTISARQRCSWGRNRQMPTLQMALKNKA